MSDEWRFLDTGPCSAAFNMALDEAIATAVRKGDAPPTLRFYGWDKPSVSIGCFQKISDIETNYCVENHVPIVRRPTGGRAILHDNEITYSFAVKTTQGEFSRGLLDSYGKISGAISAAMLKLGLPPELRLSREPPRPRTPLCFQSTSYGEITVNNKKVVGSAQKRWPDGLLQQGSIQLIVDMDKTLEVFKLQSNHDIKGLIIGLQEIFSELNPDELKKAIKTSFEESFNIRLIPLSPSRDEVCLAHELADQKYLSYEWTFKR